MESMKIHKNIYIIKSFDRKIKKMSKIEMKSTTKCTKKHCNSRHFMIL